MKNNRLIKAINFQEDVDKDVDYDTFIIEQIFYQFLAAMRYMSYRIDYVSDHFDTEMMTTTIISFQQQKFITLYDID